MECDITAELEEFALTGSPGDKKKLAFFYLVTSDVNDDVLQKASKNIQDAAEASDKEAQYLMGLMYYLGKGVDRDNKLCTEWLRKSAEQNFANASYLLGEFYRAGLDGIPACQSCAISYYKKAAEQGSQKAIDKLNDLNVDTSDVDNKNKAPDVFTTGVKNKDEVKQAEKKSKKEKVFKKSRKRRNKEKDDSGDYYASEENFDLDDYKDPKEKYPFLQIHDYDPEKNYEAEMDSYIALSNVKDRVKKIVKTIEFFKLRSDNDLSTASLSQHMAFKGNPGTAKTEIARILGGILKSKGILSSGHVVEVAQKDLIACYVGQTAFYTGLALEAAKGGILFIDEAHDLAGKGHWGPLFEADAVSTILKAMEDQRDDLIVIMAGYPTEMDQLLRTNPGLNSRIRHHLKFDDYDNDELFKIYEKFCGDNGFILTEDAKKPLIHLIHTGTRTKNETFGNGRFVRNIFELTIEKMAYRIGSSGFEAEKDLQNILFSDIPTESDVFGRKQTRTYH